MSRLNCITLRCSYNNNSFLSSFRQDSSNIDLATVTITRVQPFLVRRQSCFSLGSKTVYVLSSLLKSMVHASEFHSLFRGATQKRLRNGLRAISYATDCCSRIRCINTVDDPIARYGDYKLMTVDCTVNLCGIC